ncbi:unnamed protein product [Heterosigma akashiwo]
MKLLVPLIKEDESLCTEKTVHFPKLLPVQIHLDLKQVPALICYTEMESAAARSAANETEWSAAAAAVGEAKVIAVKWMEMEKNRVYPIDLEVKARDRRFLLSDASTVVSSKAFITDTWSKTIGIVAILRYTVELNDLEHLNDLVESILSIDGVISCQRLIRRKL